MADHHEANKMVERLCFCAAVTGRDADFASEAMRTHESHKAIVEDGQQKVSRLEGEAESKAFHDA